MKENWSLSTGTLQKASRSCHALCWIKLTHSNPTVFKLWLKANRNISITQYQGCPQDVKSQDRDETVNLRDRDIPFFQTLKTTTRPRCSTSRPRCSIFSSSQDQGEMGHSTFTTETTHCSNSRDPKDVSFPRPRRIRNNQIFKLQYRKGLRGVPLRLGPLSGEWIHTVYGSNQGQQEDRLIGNFPASPCNFRYVWCIIFSSKCSKTVWQPGKPDRQTVFVHFQTS